MKNHARSMIDKLMIHFNAVSIAELANKLETTHSTISSWINRNSVSAIEKKCRTMGINQNIFLEESILKVTPDTQFIKVLDRINNLKNTADSEEITIDFNYFVNKIENTMFMKIIFKKIENLYSETGLAGSSLRDYPVYEIAEDSDGVKYGKKALIDYILQTVKNTDIEYFKGSDTFPFIFKVNDKMMDIVSSYIDFGDGVYIEDYENEDDYNKACEKYKLNPTDAVIAAEKIIQSIKNSFSFNDDDTVWFLKNNIDKVIEIWERWLDCQRKCYIDHYESMEYDAMVENNPGQDIPPYEGFKDPRKSDEFYDFTSI